MKKAELITQVAEEAGITKVDAKKALESILSKFTKTLRKEGRFIFSGLGTFEVVQRTKRMARNPQTNEPVTVKAHRTVKFRPAKALKDLVN
jgi:DNA-binding protein HU-beta